MLVRLRKFRRAIDGVAAIEFAFIFPALLAMLVGVIEFTHYTTLNRRAEFANYMMADYLSRDDNDSMSDEERVTIQDIWSLVNPHAQQAYNQSSQLKYAVGLAAADFTPHDPNCRDSYACTFDANVQWTYAGSTDGSVSGSRISCNVSIVSDSTPPSSSTVPQGMSGRGSLVISHASYVYQALFADWFIPTFEKTVTSYARTRSGEVLDLEDGGSGYVECSP
ncbi:MAG: pilus assembly protein [Ahrensia sp.]|nr:pilus assembly protein [Ahrensia sp.]